jgi:hypothetical protein
VLTLTLSPGSPARVTGTIAPGRASVTLDVSRLVSGHRRLVSSTRVKVTGGRFAARLRLGKVRRGTFVVVARVDADARTAAGASPPVRLTL